MQQATFPCLDLGVASAFAGHDQVAGRDCFAESDGSGDFGGAGTRRCSPPDHSVAGAAGGAGTGCVRFGAQTGRQLLEPAFEGACRSFGPEQGVGDVAEDGCAPGRGFYEIALPSIWM
jgi:hypothetical protein